MSKLVETGQKYEVAFIVMLDDKSAGWDSSPVTLELEMPDGTIFSHEQILDKLPRNKWEAVHVADFDASNSGVAKFSMLETTKLNWKKGLIIKGAVIRRKYLLSSHWEVIIIMRSHLELPVPCN